MEDTDPQIGIVSVNYHANGIGGMAVEHRLHVLLETPIAHKLSEADAIIHEARQRGRPMIALISVGDLQRLNHSAQMIQLDVISSSYLAKRSRRDMNPRTYGLKTSTEENRKGCPDFPTI